MGVHNIRSPEQWEIISKQIDFKGKTVLDLGCGKGDILIRAFDAGAKVLGLDENLQNIRHIRHVRPGVAVLNDDVEYVGDWYWLNVDIIICFSVLPYLRWAEDTLKWVGLHSDIALIECQYAGDGPGFSFLTGNEAMQDWLTVYGQFENVKTIGHTLVEGRNKKRFIWKCE